LGHFINKLRSYPEYEKTIDLLQENLAGVLRDTGHTIFSPAERKAAAASCKKANITCPELQAFEKEQASATN
jgi:hypothetical protein